MRLLFLVFLFFLIQGCALDTRGDYWIPVDGADGPPQEDPSAENEASPDPVDVLVDDLVDVVPPEDAADVPADDVRDLPAESEGGECLESSACDDGNPCNGIESCDPVLGVCVDGSALPDGTGCGASPRRICLAGLCADSICGDGIVDADGGEQCEGAWSQPCDTSCGSQGTRSCEACAWTACAIPAETCNGIDDDCDGRCDEAWDCCAGSTGTETFAHCTFTTACSADCGGYVVDYGTPPSNDTCGGALPLSCPGSVSGSTCSAVNNYSPSTCAGDCGISNTYARDVVYSVTVPSSQQWRLDLDTFGSELDSVLYVRSGSCTGTELDCNDDASGGINSHVRVTLDPGTYFVIVDSCYCSPIANDLGSFTLNCAFF
jgi:hypothetical protein